MSRKAFALVSRSRGLYEHARGDRGTAASEPGARPLRGGVHPGAPCCERNAQTPFRLGTQTNRLLKAAFARGAPVAQQPADRLRARSQRIGSLIDRGSSDTVGNVSRTFSKRSRPAFPDAAFLGISESRSRTAASASAPARRPQSWRRPRSPTFRQRAELAAPRARIAAAPTTSAGGSSAICTTARSSAWSTR